MRDVYRVILFTRHWIHYGFLALITVCTFVAPSKASLAAELTQRQKLVRM
jgi:hypothetical protein